MVDLVSSHHSTRMKRKSFFDNVRMDAKTALAEKTSKFQRSNFDFTHQLGKFLVIKNFNPNELSMDLIKKMQMVLKIHKINFRPTM